MSQYIRKRILLAVPTILLTSVVVFLMLYLIPGDPASIYIGENQATPERIAAIRHSLGFDRPLYVQYGDFLWRALHGDFGRSVQTNRPVAQEILDRLRRDLNSEYFDILLMHCMRSPNWPTETQRWQLQAHSPGGRRHSARVHSERLHSVFTTHE